MQNHLRRVSSWIIAVVLFFLLTGSSFGQSKTTTPRELVFAVLPFENTIVMAKIFFPLTKYLEKRCNIKMRFVTAPTWDSFMERLVSGQYDIVYANPYHYIKAHKAFGYMPLVKVTGAPFTGILLVRKDSNIKTIKDLAGKTIAFPHRDAWAAYWLVKNHLLKKGFDMDKECNVVFVESHKRSILACYRGLADAAATWRPLRLINKDVTDALTILLETEPHPNMPVFVSPKISNDLSLKIKDALLQLHANDEGREILKNLHHH